MSERFSASLSERGATFTAGDLVEGLEYLGLEWRRAVLFGLEQRLSCETTVNLTRAQARQLPLTGISQRILEESPVHIHLRNVFWQTLEDGSACPLIGLRDVAGAAFAGIRWESLLKLYAGMVWVDFAAEADHFIQALHEQGLVL